MEKEKYIQDIKDIKDIMNRSSKFISLSGLSGVAAGVFALIGAYLAYITVYQKLNTLSYSLTGISDGDITNLILIALGTIILTLVSGIYFTSKESKKRNQKVWDHHTKRLIINLFIPLVAGGLICLMLLLRGEIAMVAPLTLVFYGLGLLNASKYTLDEVRSLGLIEIALGVLAFYYIGHGLVFWALGFGILHIIYGAIMHMRYKS